MKEFRFFAALIATGAIAITGFAYQADQLDTASIVSDTPEAVSQPSYDGGSSASRARHRASHTSMMAPWIVAELPNSRSRAEAQAGPRVSAVLPTTEPAKGISRRDARETALLFAQ